MYITIPGVVLFVLLDEEHEVVGLVVLLVWVDGEDEVVVGPVVVFVLADEEHGAVVGFVVLVGIFFPPLFNFLTIAGVLGAVDLL